MFLLLMAQMEVLQLSLALGHCVRTSPGPPYEPKAGPRHPGPTPPQSEPPDPNPGPGGLQSLPSEDHRTIKAHSRWNVSGQEVMPHPSVTSESHVTRTMTGNPITTRCQDSVAVSPKGPGTDTQAAGTHALHAQFPLSQQEVGYGIPFISMLSMHTFLFLMKTELCYYTRTIFKSDLAINNSN